MTSFFTWVKEKWKVCVGLLIGLLGVLSFLRRSRKAKEVLEHANKSHAAENKANQDALDEIAKASADIGLETAEKIEKSIKSHEKKSLDIEKEKQEFVEKSVENPDLAKDIAKHLGADYVESDK